MKLLSKLLALSIFFSICSNLFAQSDANNFTSYIIKLRSGSAQDTKWKLNNESISVSPIFSNIENVYIENKSIRLLSVEQRTQLSNLENYYVLKIDNSINSDSLISELKKNTEIENIQPNYIYRIDSDDSKPKDPKYPEQWALKAVAAEKAWQKASGKGIIIGVIDTGIDFLHPDLVNQLYINSKEDLNNNSRFDSEDLNGIDDDGNGYIDDVIGFDFVDQTVRNIGDDGFPDPVPDDEHGHGTWVSGVIAAERDNNIGICGLAYNAKILSLRAFDATGNGESDDIAASIVYAALQGANVLNFSFGEAYASPIVHDAIRFANSLGCVISASSGNNNWQYAHYPSNYDGVISVGASTEKGSKAMGSNYGSRLNLIAPGMDILTTSPNNSYMLRSGTSFSAPHVSAAAALLLELDSTLTPEDIVGILQASAKDVGEPGWDIYNGAGLLNAGAAVNTNGKTKLKFSYPPQETVFNKNKTPEISFTGSILTPMFDSYMVMLGKGEIPDSWDTISTGTVQIFADTLIHKLNLTELEDTVYTCRILVYLKNNNTIERRVNFQVVSDQTPLSIENLKAIPIFFNNSRAMMVTAQTNQFARFSVKFRPKGSSEKFTEISEIQKYTDYHSFLIQSEAAAGVEMEAEVVAVRCDGDTTLNQFTFTRSTEIMPRSDFSAKPYSIPLSYLDNETGDFYGDGKPSIVVNDISSGDWGITKIYQFDKNNFTRKDSINYTWLPVGIGDSNGDKIPEIFTTAYTSSVLFQARTTGLSPFSSVLFSDTVSGNFWGAGMCDLNHDGNDELIAYADTGFIAYTYKNGKYRFLAKAELDTNYSYIRTFPGYTSGDFDGDGNIEICHGNWEGNVFIHRFADDKFEQKFFAPEQISYSEQYICSADVDFDGKPEILVGNFGSIIPFGKNEVGEPIWTFRLLKSITPTKYEEIWRDYFYGVRAGSNYKNGVAAGNLDGQPGDEIVISTFPNLYVFKWNTLKKVMEPLWYYPNSFSNSVVIYDFDNNGIKELGFSTFSNTKFYEFDAAYNGPKTPTGLEGWALNEVSVYLQWLPSDNTQNYEIIRFVTDTTAEIAGITNETNIIINDLDSGAYYYFTVRAINSTMPDTASNIVYPPIEVYTHKPLEPKKVIIKNSKSLLVEYSGKLGGNHLEPSLFDILALDKKKIASPSSALLASDSLVILEFNNKLPSGNLILHSQSFPDYYRTPTIEKEVPFSFPADTIPAKELFLKRLDVISEYELKLEYSEPVEELTSKDILNYTLKPYGTIADIKYNSYKREEVEIMLAITEPLAALGKNYTLTVENVKALSRIPITKGAGNTLGFVFTANNGENSYVYPNPIHINELPEIYFANIPVKSEITVMSLDGETLAVILETDSNGGAEWDGRDFNGNYLKPGIYLYKVKSYDSEGTELESSLRKFAVIP